MRIKALIFAIFVLFSLPFVRVEAAEVGEQPNIVVIMTDDQRWDTVTPLFMPYTYGQLRTKGVQFTNAFVTSSVCCPSRFAFYSATMASANGVVNNVEGAVHSVGPDQVTIATRLHGVGYHTGIIGKYLNDYQLLVPPNRPTPYIAPGWDYWAVFKNNADNYIDYEMVMGQNSVLYIYKMVLNFPFVHPLRFNKDTIYQMGYSVPVESIYSTDLIAQWAKSFIKNRPEDKPYFLMVTPFGPHLGAEMVAPRYDGMFASIPRHRPPSFNEVDMSDKGSFMQEQGFIVTDPYSGASYIDNIRILMMESLRAVDDLVETIDHSTKRHKRDTVIVFTSDQGYFYGEHRLNGKGRPYDEDHRVPLIIVYPRLLGTTPRVVSDLVTLQDVCATLTEWGGAVPPGDTGMSFAETLPAVQTLERIAVPIEGYDSDRSLMYTGTRTLTHKTITWYTSGSPEVEEYDLVNDPYEMESLQ